MKMSSKLNRFSEPETLKMAKLGRELRAKGVDIIDLSLGEPDFDTPQHIKDAVKNAIDENWSHYSPVAGFADLREAVCFKLKRDNQLEYSSENIVISTGAKQSLANAILTLVDDGDEVIIPAPFWVSYSEMVKIAGGVPKIVETEEQNKFKITPSQLEESITEKSKLFLFSSPCNPSGSIYSKEELSALANVFRKNPNIYIISDEIYEYINFIGKHESIAQFYFLKDRVIIINGLSKGFAMTGYRLGYLAAEVEIAKACEKWQGQFTSGANSVTQKAAIVALTQGIEASMKMKEEFTKRRNRILEILREIPDVVCVVPDGAFYIFPNVKSYFGKSNGKETITNSDELCMYLLNEGHVSTVTGRAFGEPNCIRISFASSIEKIEIGMNRIKNALERLK